MRFVTAALLVEAVVIAGIISYVPYTEIDWRAYMEEVSGFLDGELDYRQLKGGTGPLVYPGGFVWIYSVLYYFTKLGEDIQTAQWIFAGVYLLTLGLMLRFYTRAGLSWKVMFPLFISKRIRSLYVLRLFNDCWAMLFLVVAVTLIAGVPLRYGRRSRQWLLGCFFFSFAVSIKMNVLLFAPGLLYVMLRTLPFFKVVWFLFVCATWQVLAGLPFLMYDHKAYLSKAFELGRVFTKRWSVNYQFLEDDVFVNPKLGTALLAATVATWVLVWRTRWARRTYLTSAEAKVLRPVIGDGPHASPVLTLDEDETVGEAEERTAFVATVLTLFESNLIGVIFARSLHYQFYTWFFFTIPFLLAYTTYPRLLRLVAFALIRQGFENYPPTPSTSMLLQNGFMLALFAVVLSGRDTAPYEPEPVKTAATKAEAEKAGETSDALTAAAAAAAEAPQVNAPSKAEPAASAAAVVGEKKGKDSPSPPPSARQTPSPPQKSKNKQQAAAKPAAKQAEKKKGK